MARLRRPQPEESVHEGPPEFAQPDHPVWTDRDAHLDFMERHGWAADVRDRFADTFLGGLRAEERRHHAVRAWCDDRGVRPTATQLRKLGLLPPVPSQRELYERYLQV